MRQQHDGIDTFGDGSVDWSTMQPTSSSNDNKTWSDHKHQPLYARTSNGSTARSVKVQPARYWEEMPPPPLSHQNQPPPQQQYTPQSQQQQQQQYTPQHQQQGQFQYRPGVANRNGGGYRNRYNNGNCAEEMNGDGWSPQGMPPRGIPPQNIGRQFIMPPHGSRYPPKDFGGGMNGPQRMMGGGPNNYRGQQGGFPNGGGPPGSEYGMDMVDLNTSMLSEMSLASGPPMMPMRSGMVNNGAGGAMLGKLPPQASNSPWQPPPPQQPMMGHDEFFDQPGNMSYGGPPNHGMRGNNSRGGGMFNRPGGRQNGGYSRQPPQPMFPVMQQPNQPNDFMGGGMGGPKQMNFIPQQQQSYRQGGYQPNQPPMNSGGGFPIITSTMDDYAMWTDDNDEETKKKKVLREKGLLLWGDAEQTNSRQIRRWIVGEGEEEELDTALARCPLFQKRKALRDDQLRRMLHDSSATGTAGSGSSSKEDETEAVPKPTGRKTIVPCGWGDLPAEFAEKNEFGQPAKPWEEMGGSSSGSDMMRNGAPLGGVSGGGKIGGIDDSPWNLPQNERNPFFAAHMGRGGEGGVYVDTMGGSAESWANPDAEGGILAQMAPRTDASAADTSKLAEEIRYAVEKGYLDHQITNLPSIPPTVLTLVGTILNKIPVLDGVEAELAALVDSTRPATVAATADPKSWLNDTQKVEFDRMVIAVVTAKIEVQDLSKKINKALVDTGIFSPSQLTSIGPSTGVQIPGVQGGDNRGAPGQSPHGGGASNNVSPPLAQGGASNLEYEQAPPPDQCDFYDYSFLG